MEKLEQYAFELMLKPGADPKHVKSIFAMVFKKSDAERADVKIELDRERLALAKEKVALERDKLNAASKSKIDAGLDALMAEIQASPRAMEIFQQLKAEVAKG